MTIPTQQQQQQQQGTMTGRPMDERITSLEVRVGGIEDGIKHIVAKLDNRDKLPWGVLIGTAGFVVTLIGSIGGLAFAPLSAGISDVKAGISKFESRSESYMKREDIEAQVNGVRNAVREQMDIAKERRNDLQAKTDDRIARSEKDVSSLQSQLVPRAEHAEQWAGQRQRDVELQRQIDELRRANADIATPRDTVQRLQRQVDQLERERAGRVPAPNQ